VQIGARSVVVKDDGSVTVDRNDDVGGAVDKTLEVFLVECEHFDGCNLCAGGAPG
jgi:hypothetical protein